MKGLFASLIILLNFCLFLSPTNSFGLDLAVAWDPSMVTTDVIGYLPKHQTLRGDGIGNASGRKGEGIDRMMLGKGYSPVMEGSAFHKRGAAIGSSVTDKFILMPFIKQDHDGSSYYGLVFRYNF